VSARIDEHVTKNQLQEKYQSAYRKFHSTETALKVQNDVLKFLDHGNVTVLVMLDLSAAFDTIDHKTLLQRLEHVFGITE
jgi:predicted nucleotide-binding protein (sugar kinase/HSP70/actin superfamily)